MATGQEMKSKKGSKVFLEKKDKDVEFIFQAPEAREVFLAGEFNQWNTRSLPMKKGKDGIWRTTIKLPPGRYEYKLFADDGWVEDLPEGKGVLNQFGTQNFVIRVT